MIKTEKYNFMEKQGMYVLNERHQLKLTTVKQQIKEGTKTVWETVEEDTKIINGLHYNRTIDAIPFFRNLKGTESMTFGYTSIGYIVTKLISTSPNKQERTIRYYESL